MARKVIIMYFVIVLILMSIGTNTRADDDPFLSVGAENNTNQGKTIEWYINGVLYESEYVEAWGLETNFFSQNWALTDGWGTYVVEIRDSQGNSNSETVTLTASNPSEFLILPIYQPIPNNAILSAEYTVTDFDGNDISEVVYGESIIITVVLENSGTETSDYTDVWISINGPALNDNGEVSDSLIMLHAFEQVEVPANDRIELTKSWITNTRMGTSAYSGTPGEIDITISYAPTDFNIEETDDNSDYLYGEKITIIESGGIPGFSIPIILCALFVSIALTRQLRLIER